MKFNTLATFCSGLIESAIHSGFTYEEVAESTVKGLVNSQSREILAEILRDNLELLCMPNQPSCLTGEQLLRCNLELLLMQKMEFIHAHKQTAMPARQVCYAA